MEQLSLWLPNATRGQEAQIRKTHGAAQPVVAKCNKRTRSSQTNMCRATSPHCAARHVVAKCNNMFKIQGTKAQRKPSVTGIEKMQTSQQRLGEKGHKW